MSEFEKRAYTVKEFRAAYGIGNTKFYDEVSKGNLQIKKCGDRTLVTRAEAERWLHSLPVAA